jgi:hypothetical protein
MKLLLMVAGSRSDDCGRTFEPYTVVITACIQQQGPGDEYDDEQAFDEYMAGDQTDFLEFQFNLKDEDGEVLDWYSDSIVAWAYFHSNHDGWESNWPLTFALHSTKEWPEVARLNIDREAVPHFYASHVKTPNAKVRDAAP